MRSENEVPVTDAVTLGVFLKKHRKAQGMTLQELSDHTGFGVRFISEVERGKKTAEIGRVLELCTLLGIDLFARKR